MGVRRAITVLLVFVGVVAVPAAAHADAAGPTDYRTTITAIAPAAPGVQVTVEGGDSFLMLRVARGVSVEVPGYQDEPFLRFLADGTVLENHRSATHLLSGSRYDTALPDDFDPDAPPDWRTVATDGRFAWHDHRIHWMTTVRPPGRAPGDVILRSEVRIRVDGTAVVLYTESRWLPAPSAAPAWIGAVLGLGASLAAFLRRRLRPIAVLIAGALATLVGAWQYTSLPAATGPRPIWFILPALATALAVVATIVRSRLTADALLAAAGVDLVLWGWLRRDGFTRALLATDAPGWLDRGVSAAALAAGMVAASAGLVGLARVMRSGS